MSSAFLRHALRPELVRMDLGADTKVSAIRELVGILDEAGLLHNRAEAERVVLEREEVMSTGMEYGIAIPHGKTDTVDELLVALALKPDGIDFDCADGRPATILLVTLSPASRTGPHIRLMAEVSRLLSDPTLRDRVLAASSPESVVALLTTGEA